MDRRDRVSHADALSTHQSSKKKTKQSKQRSKPYDRKKDPNAKYVSYALGPISTRPPVLPYSELTEELRNRKTMRDCFEIARKRFYPQIQPRDDYDLLLLGGKRFNEPDETFYTWADEKLGFELRGGYSKAEIANGTAKKKYLESAKSLLDGPPISAGVRITACHEARC